MWLSRMFLTHIYTHMLPWRLRWWRICLQCGRPRPDPWVRKILWRREWQPTSVFLPGGFHGQRGLVGYSPWGCKKLDTTDRLTLIGGTVLKNLLANAGNARDVGLTPGWGRSPGEGNGNLLKYSCLGKSMDRWAWQTAVHGVAKSWTQLSDWARTHTHNFLVIWTTSESSLQDTPFLV